MGFSEELPEHHTVLVYMGQQELLKTEPTLMEDMPDILTDPQRLQEV